MAFSETQTQNLSAKLKYKHVSKRQTSDGELSYIEGWHAIAEANRIFGFDSWDRHTIATKCVWSSTRSGLFQCAYTAQVRIVVRAGATTILRDGTGTGYGEDRSPNVAHDLAIKAAETDATKRALATFGNPFGLALYDRHQTGVTKPAVRKLRANSACRPCVVSCPRATEGKPLQTNNSEVDHCPKGMPKHGDGIDKSKLSLGEPKRIRDKVHLKSVARLPCAVCGRTPAQAHHIQFAQPRALGRKVGDDYTVPLCAIHHRQLHNAGCERKWWSNHGIDPLKLADHLWRKHLNGDPINGSITGLRETVADVDQANDEQVRSQQIPPMVKGDG